MNRVIEVAGWGRTTNRASEKVIVARYKKVREQTPSNDTDTRRAVLST